MLPVRNCVAVSLFVCVKGGGGVFVCVFYESKYLYSDDLSFEKRRTRQKDALRCMFVFLKPVSFFCVFCVCVCMFFLCLLACLFACLFVCFLVCLCPKHEPKEGVWCSMCRALGVSAFPMPAPPAATLAQKNRNKPLSLKPKCNTKVLNKPLNR